MSNDNDLKKDASLVSRRNFMGRSGAGFLGLGLLPALALAAGDGDNNEPANFAVNHGPLVQSPGPGEVTVTWHTNKKATAKVLYGEDGKLDRVAVTSINGLIPNDSTCHAVRLTGLTPGKAFQYRLVSREFKGYVTPYRVQHGDTIESDVYSCTPLDPNKERFSFVMWNDIHDDANRLESMFNDVVWDDIDFVVLNGDIVNDFVKDKQFFHAFYDICARKFGASIPTVYVRGNHETRGAWARRFQEYVPGRDGRTYYSFDHGGIHFLALDTGEDKEDNHKEYADLIEFDSFRAEQTAWLKEDLKSEAARNARFTIALTHQPTPYLGDSIFGCREVGRLWQPLINEAGAKLWLSGHMHRYRWCEPGEDGDNVFHAMTNPVDATVRVDVSPDELHVKVIKLGGEILRDERIPR